MKTALLLIAHGSRREEANADLLHVVAAMRQRGGFAVVEGAYLELAQPDIDRGAALCVELGAECVVLVPYFLSAGVHVRRDLMESQRRLAERYPQIAFRLAEPLGTHPLLLEVLTERAHAAEG